MPPRAVTHWLRCAPWLCLALACGARSGILGGTAPNNAGSGGDSISAVAGAAGNGVSSGGVNAENGGAAPNDAGSGGSAVIGGSAGGSGGVAASSGGGAGGAMAGSGGISGGSAGTAGGGAAGSAGAPFSSCCVEQPGPVCDSMQIQACVCGGHGMFGGDPFCCTAKWDDQCANDVTLFKCGACPGD